MDPQTIKVNLHGHGLPDYGKEWKKRLGVEGRNIAEIIANRCYEKGIGIYTLTNEPEFPGFRKKSRYQHVREAAQRLDKLQGYEFGNLGGTAFLLKRSIFRREQEVCFIQGESLRITDEHLRTHESRDYELLTFGSEGIFGFYTFNEAFRYLQGEGLPAIGEHLLAQGHHGPMEKERIEQYCAEKKFLAVEHNGKVAFPYSFAMLPPIGPFKKLRRNTRWANRRLKTLVKPHKTPIIANDDADFPVHIGSAFTEFPRDRVRMESGETIKDSLIELIKSKDFEAHEGHITRCQAIHYGTLIALS